MSFESELKKGNFMVGECNNCTKIVWPPSEFCNKCFGEITLRKPLTKGKIIEFSKKNQDYFCLVEFEGKIRIVGKITQNPNIGDTVKIDKCGIKDQNYFFEMSLN